MDAASPTGTGVVMNILAPRGGNQFKGSAIYDYQNVELEQRQHQGRRAPGGLPTAQSVNQFDVSLGGRSSGTRSGSSPRSAAPT